jgi:hypothetical protein
VIDPSLYFARPQFEVFWRGYFWGSVQQRKALKTMLTQKEQDKNLKLWSR